MELRVVTHRRWLAHLFAPYGGRMDLGLDIDPRTAQDTLWWAPGHWVARAAQSGVVLPLTSCGAKWLPEQERWTQRSVTVLPVEELTERAYTVPVHLKLPEVKSDDYPAEVVSPAGVWAWSKGLSPHDLVQVSGVVPLSFEVRAFVAHRRVVASSVYRVGDDWWDGEPLNADQGDVRCCLDLAEDIARNAEAPDGYVVDIGKSSTGDPVLLEANAAWSANPYDADIEGVLEALKAAHARESRWMFDTVQYGCVPPLRLAS